MLAKNMLVNIAKMLHPSLYSKTFVVFDSKLCLCEYNLNDIDQIFPLPLCRHGHIHRSNVDKTTVLHHYDDVYFFDNTT